MTAAQEYFDRYPCAAVFLAATSSGIILVLPIEKSYFLVIFIMKNREVYVNLTVLASFFTITRLKIIAATFRNMKKTRLNELYIYVVKIFLLKLIFRKLYSKNWKKC